MDACADHCFFLAWMLGEALLGVKPSLRESPPFDTYITTDCKSLYDCLARLGTNLQDKRTLIEICSIKEMLARDGFRWVPTSEQHADPLTKIGAHLEDKMRSWLQAPYCQLRE